MGKKTKHLFEVEGALIDSVKISRMREEARVFGVDIPYGTERMGAEEILRMRNLKHLIL